ncbi:spore germination protein PE [Bacillus oleivorans]|uniref:Spore germination protein PE n=1 Tax=Bacillus oleivorans TaxID=1448271 RepID=A0A285CSN7_9BACI|nr:spore germination protein GerPE [Bacillus oleivorans]SNX70066.1 spore germination protein PE [Bacillus oleivorans]
MWKRISHVNRLLFNTVSFSSLVRLGDTNTICSRADVFAVQREEEIFFGYEGPVDGPEISIFSERIPLPPKGNVRANFYQYNPNIFVNKVDITATSTSSIVKVGNIGKAYMESRVKHIRQLKPKEND